MIEREEQIFELWAEHPFEGRTLYTASGQVLKILSPGVLNRDSGPDFSNTRIELDGQVWSGNVEIHVRASDWMRHGHTQDKAFRNVILHIVCVHDCKIFDDHGNVIPVLVLTDELIIHARIKRLKEPYGQEQEMKSGRQRQLNVQKTVGVLQSLESLGVERLERRSEEFLRELTHLKGDMETLFQRHLFRRFGMRANSEPFQQLAHRVPGTIIRRQRSSITDLEAILFGQAALLPETATDGYAAELKYRYTNFRLKYNLEPMYVQAWKFMRMRPSNFPTVRISQLAMLLHREEHLFGRCMNKEIAPEELRAILDVYASDYWDDHYRFGVSSVHYIKQMGEETIDSILINSVAGIRYFLGVQRSDQSMKDSALQLLQEIKPERNSIIRKSEHKPVNALQSQGLLELLTRGGASNDKPPPVSDPDFMYFSRTDHERNKIHRPHRNLVRNTGVRGLRLVG